MTYDLGSIEAPGSRRSRHSDGLVALPLLQPPRFAVDAGSSKCPRWTPCQVRLLAYDMPESTHYVKTIDPELD